ncbi:MAG: hypothetical protein HYV59_10590 [Planctomycetes bacterium]|nr:hypothetical protein [Planctomycetota bacterium]
MDMYKQMLTDETDSIKKIIEILTLQLQLHKELHGRTRELKEILTGNCNEDLLCNKYEQRGLLINKIASLKKDYDSVKECVNSADNREKANTDKLLQEIQQMLNSIVILDTENIALLNNCIKDITYNLEKIQESKHFVNDLRKHNSTPPVFVDACG